MSVWLVDFLKVPAGARAGSNTECSSSHSCFKHGHRQTGLEIEKISILAHILPQVVIP